MTKAKTAITPEATQPVVEVVQPIVSKESLYTTTKAIAFAIEAAVIKGNDLQQEYQRIVCSAILHLATHKDIRVVRNLLNSLPEGMRKKSMATFIDKFAPVTFDEEGEVHYNKERKLDLAGALAMAWWKAAKESTYIPFVLDSLVQQIIDRAAKRIAKADPEKGDDVTVEQLNILGRALADIRARKAEPVMIAA